MYVWFRLARMLAAAPFKKPLTLSDTSEMGFVSTPLDVDLFFHINNGRYLSILDIVRSDLLHRSGLYRGCFRQGWTPLMSAQTVRYMKPIPTFARFQARASVAGWRGTQLFVDHQFIHKGKGVCHAMALMVIMDKQGGRVPMEQVFQTLGLQPPAPSLPPEADDWMNWVHWAAATAHGRD